MEAIKTTMIVRRKGTGEQRGTLAVSLHFFFVILLLITCTILLSLPVHADGGAPNLAYVAGAGPGIRAIDVARQTSLSKSNK